MARLYFNLKDEELERFENNRNELGLNKTQYIRYLMEGKREIRPPGIKNRELISYLSKIDKELKVLVMKNNLSDLDVMRLLTKFDDIKKIIGKENLWSSGP